MNTQDYTKTDQLVIGTPIEQTFVSCGAKSTGGVFEARNVKRQSQSVADFREMTMTQDSAKNHFS